MNGPGHASAGALILLAHGSRDARWRAPVEAVAARAAALGPQLRSVHCAYLELTAPTLAEAAAAAVAGGARSVRVVPVFLGMGKHLREDLPRLLAGLRAAHPDTVFELAPVLGENEAVLDLLARLSVQSCMEPTEIRQESA